MDQTDEEFIAQFAALGEASSSKPRFQVPFSAVTIHDWLKCALVRVVAERPAIDQHFVDTMIRAWGCHPHTSFKLLTKNIYLVNFISATNLLRVMNRGVWTYRGDVVVLKRAYGQDDLNNPQVRDMEVWTQLHGIPPETITQEGMLKLAKIVGEPLSDVAGIFAGGLKFQRVKLRLPIIAQLEDKVEFTHPILGDLNAYLMYEKLPKICLFCARIGHEHGECPDNVRMERLALDPRFKDNPVMQGITKPIINQWINNALRLPITCVPGQQGQYHVSTTTTQVNIPIPQ